MSGVREKLEEVTKGAGRFSRDPLIHAANTIEDMKDLAREAIALMESEQGERRIEGWSSGFSYTENFLTVDGGETREILMWRISERKTGPNDKPAVLILGTESENGEDDGD